MDELAQILFELIFQFLFEALADVAWRQSPEPARATVKALLAAAFAAALGFLSTLLFPSPFITARPLAIAYLILGPLLIGWIMARLGRLLERKDKRRTTLERFGYGWLFAFSFTLARFLLTHT